MLFMIERFFFRLCVKERLCCNSKDKIIATTFPKGDDLVEWGPRFEFVGTNLDQRNMDFCGHASATMAICL